MALVFFICLFSSPFCQKGIARGVLGLVRDVYWERNYVVTRIVTREVWMMKAFMIKRQGHNLVYTRNAMLWLC